MLLNPIETEMNEEKTYLVTDMEGPEELMDQKLAAVARNAGNTSDTTEKSYHSFYQKQNSQLFLSQVS